MRSMGTLRATVAATLCAAALGCSSDPAPSAADAAVTADAALPPRCTRVAPEAPPATRPAGYALSAPVEVARDGLGVPHIYGRTDEDVFYASGYTQAVDRLFQMDVVRRSARGALAALVGPERLAQDRLIHLMGVAHWGRESAARVRREHPEVYRLTSAWVAGVNRRVAEVRDGSAPRPPGFRSTELDALPEFWSDDDPYLVSRLILFRNANQLDYDILSTIIARYVPAADGLPVVQALGPSIVPPEERPSTATARRLPRDAGARIARWLDETEWMRRGASNNWAVAGRHSFNGRPLLAGDPHQPFQSPGVFWAQHMNSAAAGGSFDVAGFAFAGAPGVHLGHNASVAWTATTAYPDMMDLWSVTVTDGAIRYGGRDHPVVPCEETIEVRGQPAEVYRFDEAPSLGVLLPDDLAPLPIVDEGQRVLFRWTGFTPTAEAEVFFAFDRARDTGEFDAAVRRMEIGAFNLVAADARGVTYRSRMLVPDRGDPRTLPAPYRVLDASDPRTAWTGALLPDDRQPHSAGGARGFLFSANNEPFGFLADGDATNDPWYYGVWFDPGTRAARIESELTRLTAAGGVTVEQMEALQRDAHAVMADELLPALFTAWERAATDPSLATWRENPALGPLVELLRGWDRAMTRDASAPVVYEAWSNYFARAALYDDMDQTFDAIHTREPVFILKILSLVVNGRFANAERFLQGGRDALALRALASTATWLTTRFGGADPSSYTWRAYHRSRPNTVVPRGGEPFAVEPFAVDGSVGTVNVSQAVFFDGAVPRASHESHAVPAYRMVVSFDADGTPRARVNFPMGNAGDPTAPDWSNAHADWVEGRYRPLPFTRADVDAAARERATLTP